MKADFSTICTQFSGIQKSKICVQALFVQKIVTYHFNAILATCKKKKSGWGMYSYGPSFLLYFMPESGIQQKSTTAKECTKCIEAYLAPELFALRPTYKNVFGILLWCYCGDWERRAELG